MGTRKPGTTGKKPGQRRTAPADVNSVENLIRATRLSRIPGVTIAEACERFGVSKSAVLRARRDHTPGTDLSLAETALAALTNNGGKKTGGLGGLATVASWIDYVNHDGCSASEVRDMLQEFVESGLLSIDGERWTLLKPWP